MSHPPSEKDLKAKILALIKEHCEGGDCDTLLLSGSILDLVASEREAVIREADGLKEALEIYHQVIIRYIPEGKLNGNAVKKYKQTLQRWERFKNGKCDPGLGLKPRIGA